MFRRSALVAALNGHHEQAAASAQHVHAMQGESHLAFKLPPAHHAQNLVERVPDSIVDGIVITGWSALPLPGGGMAAGRRSRESGARQRRRDFTCSRF